MSNLLYKIFEKLILNFIPNLATRYNISTERQNSFYKSINLDRDFGYIKLNDVLIKEFKTYYDEQSGMFSEHLILLSSLSKKGFNIKKILEIGTYDGKTSFILSKIFPEAEITTIDLNKNENSFANTYKRENNQNIFINNRNKLLSRANNISFLEMNSISLCNNTKLYDLIWIDGAHGYPVVAMDVINSIRLCNNKGFILIDDIWTDDISSDKFYKSIGGYESLNELKKANLIRDFHLIPKRLSAKNNFPGKKKYIGFIKND